MLSSTSPPQLYVLRKDVPSFTLNGKSLTFFSHDNRFMPAKIYIPKEKTIYLLPFFEQKTIF